MANHVSTSGCFEGVLEDVHEPGRVDAVFDRIDNVKETLQSIQRGVRTQYKKYDKQYQITERIDYSKRYAKEHPILSLVVLVTSCMCGLPVACFFAFAFGSMLFMLLGSLFVEGLLLTIGSLFLAGSLCAMGFFSLILSSFLVLSWYTVHSGQNMINYLKRKFSDPTKEDCWTENGTEKIG